MVGNRIRDNRNGQRRSLADVAGKAGVSVATLSRIENNKQALDLELFLRLARILKIAPSELLGDEEEADPETLAERLVRLSRTERTKLWRDLAGAKRQPTSDRRSKELVSAQVDELLAQIEFVRSELETVRKGVRRDTKKRA
jgi:transcriptional regulator with XRE-family HTH domain